MTPTALDDLLIPDSPVASASLEIASAHLSPALLNHSLRSYVWAAARGTARGIAFDAELLYVASVLHDLGLVAAFDNHTLPFDEAGGHIADVFAAGAGWSARRRRHLSEVVARHMQFDIDVADDAEGHLLANSTATDVVGVALDDFDPAFRRKVVARYPRLDFNTAFLTCFQDQAARKPESSAAGAVAAGLEVGLAANPLSQD